MNPGSPIRSIEPYFSRADDLDVHLHLTPAALAKAKALGIVAAALTAGGAGGMVALSQVSSTGPTSVVVAADATSSPDPTATPDSASPTPGDTPTDAAASAAAPATAYALPSCTPGVKNHGGYVASVATSAPRGAEHGSWVSQAAHSDCGKPTPGAKPSHDAHPQAKASARPSHARESESPKPTRTEEHSNTSEHAQPDSHGGH